MILRMKDGPWKVDGLVGFTNNFLGIPWDLWQGFWEHLPGLLALHVLLYIFCSNDCHCILCLNYIVLSCLLHMHEYYTILFRHVHGKEGHLFYVYVCLRLYPVFLGIFVQDST